MFFVACEVPYKLESLLYDTVILYFLDGGFPITCQAYRFDFWNTGLEVIFKESVSIKKLKNRAVWLVRSRWRKWQ